MRNNNGSDKESYNVGYKKPPEHSRFGKGVSGNKKGRPKSSKNLKTETIEELTGMVKIRIGDRLVRVSKHRALLKILMLKAMKGDVRAVNTLLNLLIQLFGLEGMPAQTEIRLTTEERAALDLFERQLRQDVEATDRKEDGDKEIER